MSYCAFTTLQKWKVRQLLPGKLCFLQQMEGLGAVDILLKIKLLVNPKPANRRSFHCHAWCQQDMKIGQKKALLYRVQRLWPQVQYKIL